MVFHAHAGRRERVMCQELGDLAAFLDQFEIIGDPGGGVAGVLGRDQFAAFLHHGHGLFVASREGLHVFSVVPVRRADGSRCRFRAHLADLGLDAALFLLHGLDQVHQFVVVLHGFLPVFDGWCR